LDVGVFAYLDVGRSSFLHALASSCTRIALDTSARLLYIFLPNNAQETGDGRDIDRMYQNYFGFKERPFQLVPNPAYLFLSRSHEEAMAHLAYALSEGDGFIAIIGEVGTGKTTLCRSFIESLDDRCEVAYVFNPKLTAVELLEAVCDEFDLLLPKDSTTKDLIDALNLFLLEKRGAGKQVMLIIDEAQDLSREVLEQLRLLSNLETNTEKLLQVVLAGQPELDGLLGSYELRQLRQRITLSCYLTPLTLQETVQYIQHRIRIAARNQGVAFTQKAFRKIHAFSRGVPRLIHIVCDRALLAAYVMNREKITGPIVDSAIRELSLHGNAGPLRAVERRRTALLAALLCMIVTMLFFVKPMNSGIVMKTDSPKTVEIPAAMQGGSQALPEDVQSEVPSSAAQQTAARSPESLTDFLTGIDNAESVKSALSIALALWGTSLPLRQHPDEELVDPETYFSLTARTNGFLVHRMKGGRSEILKLNLPAIFEFTLPGGSGPYFLTLGRINESTLTFLTDVKGERIDVSPDEVDRFATGIVYIPWTNFFEYDGITPISGEEQGIRTLKQILERIGYRHLTQDPIYDSETESAVKEIQSRHGIDPDGLVGPLTKMVLYNELPGLDIPHIREQGS